MRPKYFHKSRFCRCVLLWRPCALLAGICLLLVLSPVKVRAEGRVLAVQNVGTVPYDEALKGFEAVLKPGAIVRRITLSEFPQTDFNELIREMSPDLLLGIGIHIHQHLQNTGYIPVVYVMSPRLETAFSGPKSAAFVNMDVAPGKQLDVLNEVLPRAKTVGLLFDPERTGPMVEKIKTAAAQKDVSIVARQVIRPRSVPVAFMEIRERIDAFWLLPDLTVATPENVEFLLLLAMESKTPVLAFSEKYVELGALLSVGVDPYDMGRQAGEMAAKILSGTDAASIPAEDPRETVISINMNIADNLGIAIDEDFLKRARIVK